MEQVASPWSFHDDPRILAPVTRSPLIGNSCQDSRVKWSTESKRAT